MNKYLIFMSLFCFVVGVYIGAELYEKKPKVKCFDLLEDGVISDPVCLD